MLKVNDSIRNAYKQKTTQRKSYIKVGDNSFFIQNLDVSADAYDKGNVIGNAIAKIAKFDIETEYVKGLNEFELFDGIWTGENYEYVSLGTFKLFEEQGTDEFFSSITSYDKLVLFNKPYDNTNVSFPISLYDFLKEICSQANVELETKRIANGDKILFQNLFVEGETLKQILKAICQISGNFAKIKNDKLVLGLYDYDSYIATGNEIVLEDVVEEKTKIKQYGYTKQETYAGTNQFNAKAIKEPLIEVNEDGSEIKMPVVSSGNGIYSTKATLSEIAPNLSVGDTVLLSFTNSSVNGYNKYIYLDGPDILWNNNKTQVITQEMLDGAVCLYGNRFVSGETEQVTIYDLRMIKGTTDKPFEPYVGGKASPSPNYPQEIEVGIGKNLLNVGTVEFDVSHSITNLDVKADTYTISALVTSNDTDSNVSRVYFYKGDSRVAYLNLTRNSRASTTVTLSGDVDRIVLYAGLDYANSTGDKAIFADLQLEKGSVATSYLPYNTIESKSTGKNLFNNKSNYTYSNVASSYWTITVLKTGVKLKTTFPTSSPYVRYVITDLTNYVGKKVRIKSNITDSTENRGSYAIGLCAKDSTNATILASASTSGKEVSFIVPELEDNKNYLFAQLYANVVNQNVSGGTVDYTDLIVTIDNEDLTYEPYKESSIQYNLGDNFLADKDYIENGVLNKNVGKVVLNGSENWYQYAGYTDNYCYYIENNNFALGKNVSVCDKFTNVYGAYINGIGFVGAYSDHLTVHRKYFISDKTTVDQWKAWLSENPVTIYYELETPEQIPLETTGELRTFEPNTIITNDLDSEMEVEYGKYIEINKDELYQPEYKRTTWKLNKVVLGMKDVEGEFVAKQDNEDIEKNGTHQLVINDNPFVYTQQLREEYIDELFERIKGFGYVAFESGFEGIPYYELGDLIKIEDKKSIILRYNLQSPKGLESTFSAPSIIDSVIEYTQTPNVLEQKMRSTELRVEKAEGNIIGITQQTSEIRDNLNKNYYTIEQANTLIQNAETGVTNTFSEAGGNNVFRNTGLWFANSGEDAETNPYEFWKGKANEGSNDKATNYRSILLGKGSFIQDDVEVPNGNYSISFYYRKLIASAIASVVINDKEYELNSLEIKQFYTGEQDSETGEYIVDPIVVSNGHIKIEFKCDALDGVEVYDLMCNKGSVKLAYSQNQNETTTDTVNISKGITITSSADENTKFKADYDGIRVLDKSGNIKTKFTDKGTETDELLVRKKATITGLLHQEVDDQTWVTKI